MIEGQPLIDPTVAARLVEALPDPASRERLIEMCVPLADRLALRYRHTGEAPDDLTQVARMGLLKAVDRADPTQSEAFLGYATTLIRGELRHHIRDRTQLIRRPRDLHVNESLVRAAIDQLTQQLGRSPTISEIAAQTDLPAATVFDVYGSMTGSTLSVHELDGSMLAGGSDDSQEFTFVIEWESVAPALARLPQSDRRIIYMRFFRELTQSEIAAELGVSQVQVSRLLRRALDRVRTKVS